MPSSILVILTSATLGQALLSLSLLLGRPRRRASDTPLAITLVAAATVLALSVATALPGADRGMVFALSLPAWLTLAPALRFYVEALTAEIDWRPRTVHVVAFLPATASIAAFPMVLALSPTDRRTMFVEGHSIEAIYPLLVGVSLFLLIGWGTAAAGAHALWSFRRLAAYRQRLRALFANNDRRELRWLTALLAVLATTWLLAVLSAATTSLFERASLPAAAAEVVGLVAVWTLALIGLGQAPGFEGRHTSAELTETAVPPKYLKSPQTPEQADQVAARIEAAMRGEQLYLDPNLSLPKLAARVRLPPNLVSQTLNQHLGVSFFTYVNRKRVEAAAALMATGEGAVLEIALEVGFNSKSSFYRAFHDRFGMSPARYARALPRGAPQ